MEIEEFKKRFNASNSRVAKIKEKQQNEFHKLREIKGSKELQTVNVNKEFSKHNTLGNRVADRVAKFGGSWSFIIIFVLFLVVWMTINVTHPFGVNFDPYPFILLNLFLSCVAAIQAPVIMMSQNRAGERDKLDADNNSKVNLASNEKLDNEMSRLDHQKARINELDTKLNLIAELLISQSTEK